MERTPMDLIFLAIVEDRIPPKLEPIHSSSARLYKTYLPGTQVVYRYIMCSRINNMECSHTATVSREPGAHKVRKLVYPFNSEGKTRNAQHGTFSSPSNFLEVIANGLLTLSYCILMWCVLFCKIYKHLPALYEFGLHIPCILGSLKAFHTFIKFTLHQTCRPND